MPLTPAERFAIQDRLADLCEEAKKSVKGGEHYKATIILRAPHLPDGDVVVTEDPIQYIVDCLRRAAEREA